MFASTTSVCRFGSAARVSQWSMHGDDYTGLIAGLTGGVLMVQVCERCGSTAALDMAAAAGCDEHSRVCWHHFCHSRSRFVGLAYVATHSLDPRVPAPNLGVEREDVRFQTRDGLTLSGWYVRSSNGAAVIGFPRPKRDAEAHPDARPARLRHPAVRSPRRGRG